MTRAEALEYLKKRSDFHAIAVVPSLGSGGLESGFDVVLRLDGSYSDRGMAIDVARMFATDVLPALGLELAWAPEGTVIYGGVVLSDEFRDPPYGAVDRRHPRAFLKEDT